MPWLFQNAGWDVQPLEPVREAEQYVVRYQIRQRHRAPTNWSRTWLRVGQGWVYIEIFVILAGGVLMILSFSVRWILVSGGESDERSLLFGFLSQPRAVAWCVSLRSCPVSHAPAAPLPWPLVPGAAAESLVVVAQIPFADSAELRRLSGRLDVWEVDHAQGTLVAQLSAAEYRELLAAGVQVVVDWQRTAQVTQLQQAMTRVAAGIPGYACYRTVEETYADLAQLAAAHPNLARWVDIGDSWQKTQNDGGYDLRALVLTNQERPGPKPVLFLMAAIHARELTTAETATRFAERLVAGYGPDPDITWLLDYNEIHIVPQVNPDGRKRAEGGVLWRKNTNDSNGSCSPRSNRRRSESQLQLQVERRAALAVPAATPCDDTYRGPAPASEPEVAALEAYMRTIFPDQRGPGDSDPAPGDATGVMITLHSYGNWVLFPWGWTNSHGPNDAALRTLGRKFGFYTGYTVCQAGEDGCIYPTDGTTDDFAYGDLGVAAYTFELGNWFFEDCSTFTSSIIDPALTSLMVAAKAARQPYRTPAGPEVIQASVTPTQVLAGGQVTLTVAIDSARYATNDPDFGIEPVQPITAAHYTVDAPGWISGTVAYSLTLVATAPDGLQATARPSSTRPAGRRAVISFSQKPRTLAANGGRRPLCTSVCCVLPTRQRGRAMPRGADPTAPYPARHQQLQLSPVSWSTSRTIAALRLCLI